MAVAALAGCGGADNGADGTPGPSAQEKAESAALKHARCMRENGVDVPDPKPGEGGLILQGPPEDGPAAPEQMEKAVKACEKHLAGGGPLNLSEEQKGEMQEAALKHARCMREQGVDFPDPEFDENGAAAVRIGEGFNPTDPAVRRAEKTCAKYGPQLGAVEAAP